MSFGRDGSGRITSLTDPTGKQIRYGYDVNGDLISVTDRDKLLVTKNVEGFRDGIYIMPYDSLLNVKRLQRQPGKKVRVTSDNPTYEPFDVDLNDESTDFCLLGKVVWIVHRSAF